MKYRIGVYVNEKHYCATASVRRDAKMKTKFIKCMNAIGNELIKARVIDPNTTYGFELPNIWTNGYLGAAWFNSPFINVVIQEDTGAWLAL